MNKVQVVGETIKKWRIAVKCDGSIALRVPKNAPYGKINQFTRSVKKSLLNDEDYNNWLKNTCKGDDVLVSYASNYQIGKMTFYRKMSKEIAFSIKMQ